MSDNVKSSAKIASRATGGGTLRQRRSTTGTTANRARTAGGGSGGMNSGGLWRFYTEDSTGLKIGPVPVLVMSLVFIASVFILHIWGKFSRSH